MTNHLGRRSLKHRSHAVRLTADVVLPPLSIANVSGSAITMKNGMVILYGSFMVIRIYNMMVSWLLLPSMM